MAFVSHSRFCLVGRTFVGMHCSVMPRNIFIHDLQAMLTLSQASTSFQFVMLISQ